MFRALFLTFIVFGLVGCSPDTPSDPAELSAQELYDVAVALHQRERYAAAQEAYGQVEQFHPLSAITVDAQYQRALALYQGQFYPKAVQAFDRFLEFNPGHEREQSAAYFRALSFYEEIPDVYRDQGVTQRARQALNAFVLRFPETPEAEEAKAKLVLVRDQLAGHTMVIGRSYQQQNRFVAAQNRFLIVINDFPTTGQVPEAFYRLVETSLALGLEGEAQRYAATLGHNFPANPWYARAYDLLEPNYN